MPKNDRDLNQLYDQLSHHMQIILKCTVASKKYGRLLLASPPESRYPYIYPRDRSCAVQWFRRVALRICLMTSVVIAFSLQLCHDQHRNALLGCQEQSFEGVGSHPLRPFNSLLTLGPNVSHFR